MTSHEGPQIESLTMSYGLQQLIFDPTHLLSNSSSCIDLIFMDQPNLIVDSGVHPSLHPKCHHQITYRRCNLTVEYPPNYERFVWNADIESIKQALIGTRRDVGSHAHAPRHVQKCLDV